MSAPAAPPNAPVGAAAASAGAPRAPQREAAAFVAALASAAQGSARAERRAQIGAPQIEAPQTGASQKAAWRAGEAQAPPAATPSGAREPAPFRADRMWRLGEAFAAAPAADGAAPQIPQQAATPPTGEAVAPPVPALPGVPAAPAAADEIPPEFSPGPDRAAAPAPPRLAPGAETPRAELAAHVRAAARPADEPARIAFETLPPAGPVVETHLPPARWPQALHRLAEAAQTAAPALAAPTPDEAAPRPVAQVLRLALEPERLGAVSVTLRLRGGALEARLDIERPETAALVEARRGELVEAFRRSGYEIGEIVLTPAQESRLRHGPDPGSSAHAPSRDPSDDRARRDGADRGESRGEDAPRRGRDGEAERRDPRRRDSGAGLGAVFAGRG